MSSEHSFSIVIPTRNRWPLLLEVLQALARQREAPGFEVLIVDDGSDAPPPALAPLALPYPIELLRQEARGPAAARNLGVRTARFDWVAFLGDDTIPEPAWLGEHARAHSQRGWSREIAVVGYTTWHPRIPRTPWLEYLNEEGPQFGYGLIEDPECLDHRFFYTSNLTLARAWLLEEPFDETFPDAAWEDVEAAYRMMRQGLRLIYHPPARVLHDHTTDPDRFAERQERCGMSAVRFVELHPELGDWLGIGPGGPPPRAPLWLRGLRRGLVRSLHRTPLRWRGLWREALRDAYLEGLHRGWARRRGRSGEGSP